MLSLKRTIVRCQNMKQTRTAMRKILKKKVLYLMRFSNVAGTIFKKPKVEEDELFPVPLQQQPLKCNVENIRTESLPASVGPVSSRPTSPAPVSPHQGGRNKGKQTVEPIPLAVQERPNPIHIYLKCMAATKERNLYHLMLLPIGMASREHLKHCALKSQHLILPINDDIPADEIPISVIHPDSLNERGFSAGDFSTAKPHWQEPPESLHADKIVGAGASASMNERHSSCDLATVPKEIPSGLEIASTPLGEVKISISYNSAIGRPNFQLPSVDELRELMEQRCLQSYKLIDPNFDVLKVLSDMCECILELATNSSNKLQDVNVIPALDILKQTRVRDVLNAVSNTQNGCFLGRMLNESFNVQCSTNVCVDNVGGKELMAVPKHGLAPDEIRWLHDAIDITRGEEKVKISWMKAVVAHALGIVSCPSSFAHVLFILGEILYIHQQVF
ncbi:Set domain protein [Hibiscus syriacus]|uniref:Set domain protein n=1 Tax=Hibiscus syriacus TaxID=106335 RepID=A0A6A3CGK0_HIBSY|nr:Set domain protein [Hibiscus syriacus]